MTVVALWNYTPQNKHGTWKWTLGKGDSYWKPSFPGSMLIFGGVYVCKGIDSDIILQWLFCLFQGGLWIWTWPLWDSTFLVKWHDTVWTIYRVVKGGVPRGGVSLIFPKVPQSDSKELFGNESWNTQTIRIVWVHGMPCIENFRSIAPSETTSMSLFPSSQKIVCNTHIHTYRYT